MKAKILILAVLMLLGIHCLCFAETRKRQGVDIDESPAEVEIYITDWCPYCAKAIKFLETNGINYVVYDVEKDREAAQRKKELSGRKGVPFAIINGKKIYGYSEASYSKALGIRNRSE
jgi:glutaredoxin